MLPIPISSALEPIKLCPVLPHNRESTQYCTIFSLYIFQRLATRREESTVSFHFGTTAQSIQTAPGQAQSPRTGGPGVKLVMAIGTIAQTAAPRKVGGSAGQLASYLKFV